MSGGCPKCLAAEALELERVRPLEDGEDPGQALALIRQRTIDVLRTIAEEPAKWCAQHREPLELDAETVKLLQVFMGIAVAAKEVREAFAVDSNPIMQDRRTRTALATLQIALNARPLQADKRQELAERLREMAADLEAPP